MAKTGVTGFKRVYNAFFYSLKGLRAAYIHEAAIRQELVLCIPLTILAFFISSTVSELLILVLLPWLTFTFELTNSAIEAVVDRISDDYHELSGRAKDIGSALVFVFLILTSFAYIVVLGKYFGLWFVE